MTLFKTFSKNKILFHFLYIILITVYNLYLVDAPSPFLSENDSLWFVEKANTILSGNWLGPYDKMTLIKNPFYPIFLSFIKFSGFNYSLIILILFQISIFFFINSLNFNNLFLKIIFFTVIFFYPEQFTTYKATVIREDLEIIFLLIFSGSMGYILNKNKINFIFMVAFISSLALINKDSGTAWMASFIFAFIFFVLKNYRKISNKRIIVYLLLSLIILKTPTYFVRGLNSKYYQFNGTNIFFSSKYSKVYESLISIRPVNYKPNKLRNPIDNSTINAILNIPGENDVKGILNLLQTKYQWYKLQSTSLPNWGSGLMWGLLYSFLDYYDEKYQTLKSGKNINVAAEKFISEVTNLCKKNIETLNCKTYGKGYIQSPDLWSSKNPLVEVISNIPNFFLKYVYWSFGEQSNPLTLAPRNDDIHWISGREKEAHFLLSQLNYSKEKYYEYRLSSHTLKILNIFSYCIRYGIFLFCLFLIMKIKKFNNKNLLRTMKHYHFSIFLVILFLLHNLTYYLFYLLILKRGYKYIVITGAMISPILISVITNLMTKQQDTNTHQIS